MLSYDGHSYAYDGEGRRIAQTAGGSATRYVLDVQRRLPAVIGAKAGSDITHYMHGPLGMFAQRNPDASWDWMLHDGLGSVRGVFDGTLQSAAEYDPFGEPIVAPIGTAYGFTGELTDGNGLVYLRARYLAASLGTFASRDPWRGSASAPRTWNGYAWVEGNVVNRVDPGGMAACQAAPVLPACPAPGEHPLVESEADYEWLYASELCYNGSKNDTFLWELALGLPLTTQLPNAFSELSDTYGITLVNPITSPMQNPIWSWDDLAAVARGFWLIENAVERIVGVGPSAQSLVRNAFRGTEIRVGAGGGVGDFQSRVAFTFANILATVPPVGLGGDGRTMYIDLRQNPDETIVHELAHILDFKLGTTFTAWDLDNPSSPSNQFRLFTRGAYSVQIAPVFWSLHAVTASAGYVPGGSFTTDYAHWNHYEDFADSFEYWVTRNPSGEVDQNRLDYFDLMILDLLYRSGQRP